MLVFTGSETEVERGCTEGGKLVKVDGNVMVGVRRAVV